MYLIRRCRSLFCLATRLTPAISTPAIYSCIFHSCIFSRPHRSPLCWLTRLSNSFNASGLFQHAHGLSLSVHLVQRRRLSFATNSVQQLINNLSCHFRAAFPNVTQHCMRKIDANVSFTLTFILKILTYVAGVLHLRCRYRTPYAAQSQWNTLRVFSADQPVTSVTLYQLRPNSFYEVMVLARNRIGDALFSEPHGVRTKGQWRCARALL